MKRVWLCEGCNKTHDRPDQIWNCPSCDKEICETCFDVNGHCKACIKKHGELYCSAEYVKMYGDL